MDEVTLLTSDLDFKPLVDALVRDGMFVTLFFEETSASEELMLSADARLVLGPQEAQRLAGDQFRKAHPVPSLTSGKKRERGAPIKHGRAADGRDIYLYRSGDLHVISMPRDTQESWMEFEDLDYLEFFFRDQVADFTWLS